MCNTSAAVFANAQSTSGRGNHTVFPAVNVPDRSELEFPLRYLRCLPLNCLTLLAGVFSPTFGQGLIT